MVQMTLIKFEFLPFRAITHYSEHCIFALRGGGITLLNISHLSRLNFHKFQSFIIDNNHWQEARDDRAVPRNFSWGCRTSILPTKMGVVPMIEEFMFA